MGTCGPWRRERGRPAAANQRLVAGSLVRLVDFSASRRFTNALPLPRVPLARPGKKDDRRAGLRRPPCLRSGRDEGGRDRFVLVVWRVRSGFSVAMPFEEEDESPFVGLLQLEAV